MLARWDGAVSHFEDALEMNAEMGARPWLAYTQCDFGRMLLARDLPGDHARANELMATAQVLSEELGMRALSEKIAALRRAEAPVR
jgi:hypothetical protein